MAKILVADDNSNVQKTVALALADLGIEVVAVNNGEAAVKKLPDAMPDLVLADIFMPVRNGYEVCEYVKKDSRFSHIPVVLLVGAFDPLDEREAQRVGADGILKKPFVPPDPLIAMVKTLLDRTLGDRMVPAAVSMPAAVSKQSRSGGVAVADDHEPTSAVSEDLPDEAVNSTASRLSFGDGERPVAFSQLLEAPEMKTASSRGHVDERADNDQILTSTRDESLGAPIFWKTESPEKELNSEDIEAGPDDSTEIPAVGWRFGNEDASTQLDSESKKSEEPLELVLDAEDASANEVSAIIEPTPMQVQDAASQASLTVEASKAPDLAANPLEWMASVPPPREEEAPTEVSQWSSLVPMPTDPIEVKEPEPLNPAAELASAVLPAVSEPSISASATAERSTDTGSALPIPEPSISITEEQTASSAQPSPDLHGLNSHDATAKKTEDTVRSIPKQDWSDLAASIQVPVVVPEQPPAIQATAITAPWASVPHESKPSAQSIEDTAHSLPKHDWADLVSDLNSQKNGSNSNRALSSPDMASEAKPSVESNAKPEAKSDAASAPKPSNKNLEVTVNSMPKLDWADLAASIQPQKSDSDLEKAKAVIAAFAKSSAASSLSAKSTSSVSATATLSETPANIKKDDGAGADALPSAAVNATSSGTPAEAPTGTPDPALVEAVVQRVLDKMRPQVVDIITKEFLRPVVQALVHREITKK